MTAEQRRLARFARFKKEKPTGKKGNKATPASQGTSEVSTFLTDFPLVAHAFQDGATQE